MKKNFLKLILISAFSFSMVSCSSILNGKSQNITVTTNVENVKEVNLYKNGILVARGKNDISQFTLDRKESYAIEVINKKGEKAMLQLNKDFTTSFLVGNFFFGGIPGWIIDMVTGAGYKFSGQSPEIMVN